jgi:hypothetical protein
MIRQRKSLVVMNPAHECRRQLKASGLLACKGVGKTFAEKVRSLISDGPLHDVVETLLRAWEAINKEVTTLSRRLVTEARQDDTVCQLMTAPGVGVLSRPDPRLRRISTGAMATLPSFWAWRLRAPFSSPLLKGPLDLKTAPHCTTQTLRAAAPDRGCLGPPLPRSRTAGGAGVTSPGGRRTRLPRWTFNFL